MDKISSLINDLKSEEQDTREAAARSLYELGLDAKSSIPALVDALLCESDACPWIGTAITEIGPDIEQLPKLQEALKHSNPNVRFWAARAAVKLGPSGEPLIEDLLLLLLDENHPVADSVLWALASIGEASIPKLIGVTERGSVPLRARALIGLGKFEEHTKSTLPILLQAMDDGDRHIRSAVGRAICGLAQGICDQPQLCDTVTTANLVAILSVVKLQEEQSRIDIEMGWADRVLGWMRQAE